MKRNILSLFIVLLSCCAFAQSANDASAIYSSYSKEDIKISLFPNPATDYINVQDKDNVVGNVVVYNLAGRKIKSFAIDGNQLLNIMDLPKGMYLIQFTDKRDKLLTTQRLSKR